MIDELQAHLEAIYGIRCEQRASSFLMDEAQARALGHTVRAREELLIHETSEGLELGLYLDPSLLDGLAAFSARPADALDDALPRFLQVAEGVSHFVYMNHSARLDRRLSLLELEAQAEVDKFALGVLLRWGNGAAKWAGTLLERVFDRVSFLPSLSGDERHRYEEANRLARRFCARLLPQVKAGHVDRFLATLRHAYRLGAEAKLRHFAHA